MRTEYTIEEIKSKAKDYLNLKEVSDEEAEKILYLYKYYDGKLIKDIIVNYYTSKDIVIQKFERYEYPLKDSEGEYLGSYTIKVGETPKKFKGEKKVETFFAITTPKKKWREIIESTREY